MYSRKTCFLHIYRTPVVCFVALSASHRSVCVHRVGPVLLLSTNLLPVDKVGVLSVDLPVLERDGHLRTVVVAR